MTLIALSPMVAPMAHSCQSRLRGPATTPQTCLVHIVGPDATCPDSRSCAGNEAGRNPTGDRHHRSCHPTLSEAVIEAAPDFAGETQHFISQG